MGIPYPWHLAARWPLDYLRPTTRSAAPMARESLHRPSASAGRKLRCLFVGDLMHTRGGIVPGIDPGVRRLFSRADLVVGNCEGTLGEAPVGTLPLIHRERMSVAFLVELMRRLGHDPRRWVLSVANNHAGDRGREGLDATADALRGLGATTAGLRRSHRPSVSTVDVAGLRLGIVAWTEWINHDVFASGPGPIRGGDIANQDWPALKARLGLDGLIAAPHWDREFHHFPAPATRRLARSLAAGGFDVVAGHHPHVLQPLELIGDVPCLYSLGNLCGPSIPLTWPMRLTAAFEVFFHGDGPDTGRVAGYTLHPIVQLQGPAAPRLVRLEDSPALLRARLTRRLGLMFRL
jgi:poly-gamma-glutamate synthesis protein (capsule biosynthesis protein)